MENINDQNSHLFDVRSKMSSQRPNIDSIAEQYHASDENAREQLFADFFQSHYDPSRSGGESLASNLDLLVDSLSLRPPVDPARESGKDDLSNAFQEVISGMYMFCLANPSGIDFAWSAMLNFISRLGTMTLCNEQVDAKAVAMSDLQWWVGTNASGDPCDLSDDGPLAHPSDITVCSLTRQAWETNAPQQLEKLALNRKARKDHIVNKIIQGRALRDGYANSTPRHFRGAYELRFIEMALKREPDQPLLDGAYQSSADVVAATFLLRACAKSLLASLPDEGCIFDSPMRLDALEAGPEGKDERLQGWKKALEAYIVDFHQQSNTHSFAIANYAALALENLQDPRDESIEELLAWDKIVF